MKFILLQVFIKDFFADFFGLLFTYFRDEPKNAVGNKKILAMSPDLILTKEMIAKK